MDDIFMSIRRHRSLRKSSAIRGLVRETVVSADDLIYPLFVIEGEGIVEEVPTMPGVFRVSIDKISAEIDDLQNRGITSVMLFGIPENKDGIGSGAYDENGVIQRAVRTIKAHSSSMCVMTDVCLCEYTDHGHCGIVREDGTIDNDATLELLALTALSHAYAGSDVVAPSDMMDGRVAAIRTRLDTAGFVDTPIMSYSAKYASAFYAPFREAAESSPAFGDRKTYQMDYSNTNEALREVAADIEEGASIVMVKPGLSYLDIVRRVKDEFAYPTCVYNVSGEYAMVKAASKAGLLDERSAVLEILTSFKRAGADMIISYHAKEAAAWL